jgi:predicted dehydrogenase
VIGIGVIGYGYWGPNLARNFADVPDARLAAVCDRDPARLASAARRYPGTLATADPAAVLRSPDVDAVAVATPVSSHFDLARQALEAGKHAFVEKPLAASAREAAGLVDLAAKRGRVLMVDHTFVYTGAVRRIHDLVRQGELGEVYYYDSTRVNLGLFQHDVNVLWDLAVHDLAILDHVLPERPVAVSATGMSHVPGEPENLAYLTLFFGGSLLAHIHVNWLAPVKLRRTLIGGSRKMIVYDDLEPSEKLRVYDKGITIDSRAETVYQMLIGYRTGDMWAPQVDTTEALQAEARHFVQCIQEGGRPVTDGEVGLRIVQILEAATESVGKRGALVNLCG